jgi:hypothetical protein
MTIMNLKFGCQKLPFQMSLCLVPLSFYVCVMEEIQ